MDLNLNFQLRTDYSYKKLKQVTQFLGLFTDETLKKPVGKQSDNALFHLLAKRSLQYLTSN